MIKSVKLSITVRKRLERKYSAAGLAAIDRAIADWVRADKARGITTVHVAVDDRAAMKRLGVKAVTGLITAAAVKRALDRLALALSPDYIVLLGAADVVPMFLVANPSAAEGGDDDDRVPTDNPYACSRPFKAGARRSYLVPDRVLGRIPDLPGSGDPSWLVDYLAHAAAATPRPAVDYRQTLMVCCRTWKQAGVECVETLGHEAGDLLISPPAADGAPEIRRRRKHRLHLIKCHGADEDSRFYGEGSTVGPDALSSPTLVAHTSRDTVVGAMCCYGADLFDPASPTAQHRPEPPIPSVYLKQGAHGFAGASTIAWVGNTTMLCADWLVTAFLKSATAGASLGRAMLEAKQDYLRWLQQQAIEPDVADEKTLIQFLLLGDPSIHPARPAVTTPAVSGAGVRVAAVAAAPARAAAPPSVQRRRRRAARFELGALLRGRLSLRQRAPGKKLPSWVAQEAHRILRAVAGASKARLTWAIRTDRLVTSASGTASGARVAAAGTATLRPGGASLAERQTYQYYWIARQHDGVVRRISMVTVQADARGRVLGSRMVVSS